VSWREHLRAGIAQLRALRPVDYAAARPTLARLDCNELAFGPTAGELERFAKAVSGLALQRYPDISGRPLREALARRWQVEPDEILLGNGSVEILGLLMTAFGAGTGDEPAKVLYPDPSFPYYEVLARTHGLAPVPVTLDEHFQLDEERFVAAIDDSRPALALFASPNNPSGNRFDRAVLERLAMHTHGAFVVDEAYADFAGGTMLPLVRTIPGLFVLRSLSKIGLAGLRLGALVAARDVIAELDKVRLPWNIGSVTSALGCAALARADLLDGRVRAVVELRRAFERGLCQIPRVVVYPSDANFLLVRLPEDASTIFRRLLQEGVLVRDVSRPGLLDRCIRISVGTSVENARCVGALNKVLDYPSP
jgi:histidinol-phosphate aminotransferase